MNKFDFSVVCLLCCWVSPWSNHFRMKLAACQLACTMDICFNDVIFSTAFRVWIFWRFSRIFMLCCMNPEISPHNYLIKINGLLRLSQSTIKINLFSFDCFFVQWTWICWCHTNLSFHQRAMNKNYFDFKSVKILCST